jgi:hypothetical protein
VTVNLILYVLAPTSYLWRCATGAHQPCHIGLDAPDQGVDQGPSRPLGQFGGDQPNILPLDLNSYRLYSHQEYLIFLFFETFWASAINIFLTFLTKRQLILQGPV